MELFVNGKSAGRKPNEEWMGWTAWNVTWAAGNVTAVATNKAGHVVATHSRVTASAATSIVLSLDAPHASTATGHKVVLDGHDVALVRATVVDARGNLVPTSTVNVSFEIASGPGRVLGVGNGDENCRLPHQVRWRPAFSGLSRAVIKVTEDGSRPGRVLGLVRSIDVDGGREGSVQVHDPAASPGPLSDIVITATAPGLVGATLSIPVSTSTTVDGMLASARSMLTHSVSLE